MVEAKSRGTVGKPGGAIETAGGFIPTRSEPGSWNLSKITPPTTGAAASNERLFRRLDAALSRPIIWVQGAPGAGKTTLVASYLAAKGIDPLWYRLDADDADPATLFFFLGIADARARNLATPRLPALTSEYSRGVGAFSRSFFQKLFDSPDWPILVLDDYHEVSVRSSVHARIAEGLKEVPETAHVLIISRAPPPKEFARLRINGAVDVIPPDLLKLNPAEAAAIARARSLTIAAPLVDRLVDQTQGWTAGLILMMEAAEWGTVPDQITVVPELLFDYFVGEVFQQMEKRSQELLMMLSVMPSMTAITARTVARDCAAASLVEDLARRSYFTVRDAEAEPNYRFHPLFREFLLTNARRLFAEKEWVQLLMRAADVLERAGQPDAAVPLLQEIAAWDDLSRIVRDWADSLIRQGRSATLIGWLERLPADRIENDAWLSYWMGKARIVGDPPASRPFFNRALRLFEDSDEVRGVFLAWAGWVEAITQDPFGSVADLDAHIDMLAKLMVRHRAFPDPEVECCVASSMLAALTRRRCDRAETLIWQERALSSAAMLGDPIRLCWARAFAVVFALIDGDYAMVRDFLDLLPPPTGLERSSLLQEVCIVVGFAQLSKQVPGRCEDTAELALRFADNSGMRRWSHLLAVFAATEACREGDLAKAKKWLRRTAELTYLLTPHKGAHYFVVSSYIALQTNDVGGALQSARKAVELATATGWHFYEALAHCAMAEALSVSGEQRGAEAELAAVDALVQSYALGSFLFSSELLRADFLLARGQRDAGRAALQKAMTLGERREERRTRIMPSRCSRLCAQALEDGIEEDFVRLLIRTERLPPPELRVEQWPWPLKITTLGGFSVAMQDEPLIVTRKTPRRLFTLLKAIVAFGGTNIAETQLIDAVWPEEEGDAGRRAFDVAVHRLRKLIGDGSLIILKGGRLSLDRARCWLDLWAFEEGISSASSEVALAKKLALYRGAFLSDDDDLPFIEPRRRQLASRFLRATETLAKRYGDTGDWNRMSKAYRAGIEAHPEAETLYQGLMRCYAQLGQLNGIHDTYHLLCSALARAGLKPAMTSNALYRKLVESPAAPT